MSHTITITGKDRPELFRDLLASLRANDLDGWRISIAIDGDRAQDFAEIARGELDGLNYELTGNDKVLGISLNPFQLLSRVFAQGSTLNLYLEEDFLVSPDATRLALWYQRNHKQKWACLNLVSGPCGSSGYLSNPAYPDTLFEANTFNSLGFVTRDAEWFGVFRPHWLQPDDPPHSQYGAWRTHWGWDWSIYGLIADGDLVSLQPALARVTHKGETGTYSRASFQEAAFGNMEINHTKDLAYRVADAIELPHPLRSHINLHREHTARLILLERMARGLDSRRG